MKSEVAGLMYTVVAQRHRAWHEIRGYCFNNAIIDMLRNKLAQDAHEWFQVHIKKRHVCVSDEFRCLRDIHADLSVRRFRGTFGRRPCEICGSSRVPNVAHIIPRAIGGPDDDWNLVHMCANHHYLFDRGLLTREEYETISWNEKGSEARYYADKIRQPQHEVGWSGTA